MVFCLLPNFFTFSQHFVHCLLLFNFSFLLEFPIFYYFLFKFLFVLSSSHLQIRDLFIPFSFLFFGKLIFFLIFNKFVQYCINVLSSICGNDLKVWSKLRSSCLLFFCLYNIRLIGGFNF